MPSECPQCSSDEAIFLTLVVAFLFCAALETVWLRRNAKEARVQGLLWSAKRRQIGTVPGSQNTEKDDAAAGDVAQGMDQNRKQPWEIEFNELKLQSCLAKGSNGAVYKGTWLGTVVAIKVPHAHLSELMKEKFVEEAFLMSKLHHPNIVMFLAACLEPTNLALVLEYLPLGSLHDFLKDKTKEISLGMVHRFVVDIARGMRYLHTRCSIIQRDLKPRNLLIDEALNVKVCDFGLSKAIEKDDQAMTACGTPYWTAPEVIKNDTYDEKADVYSFSIILYELIAREEPYSGLPGLEVAVKVAHSGLRPKIPSFCPEEYSSLMEDCWQDNPNDRPSFSQVLERLNQIKKLHVVNDAEQPNQIQRREQEQEQEQDDDDQPEPQREDQGDAGSHKNLQQENSKTQATRDASQTNI